MSFFGKCDRKIGAIRLDIDNLRISNILQTKSLKKSPKDSSIVISKLIII